MVSMSDSPIPDESLVDDEETGVTDVVTSTASLDGRRVGFLGKLGSMTKREAQQVVRQHSGVPFDRLDEAVDPATPIVFRNGVLLGWGSEAWAEFRVGHERWSN